jgi:hypothetical protein
MFVYAGIDEAGYGPLFGPLVIARTTFVLDRHEPVLEPPSLWRLLRSTVCKKPGDKKKRLAINDSKRLYKPAWSLEHIERGVLSFLSASGIIPENLSGLLEHLAYDLTSCQINHDWYRAPDGEPRIPLLIAHSQLERSKNKLHRSMLNNSVRLTDINAAVVFEDRFNQMLRITGSKAACAWAFVSGHLKAIWERYGQYHPLVVVDRQGGRKSYLPLLETVFSPAELTTMYEHPLESSYRISHRTRRMHVLVQVRSEQRHFPVALASMAAKYMRELLMIRFQNYWSLHAPDIKPTFGYFGDGRRFLREIQPLIADMKIDPEIFIRNR